MQDHSPAGGPEREPQANLSRSPSDGVGNHGIDSDRGEAEQEWPEHGEHPRRNPAKIEISFDVLGKCSHVVKREHGIEIAENGTRLGGQSGFIAAARPQMNFALVL